MKHVALDCLSHPAPDLKQNSLMFPRQPSLYPMVKKKKISRVPYARALIILVSKNLREFRTDATSVERPCWPERLDSLQENPEHLDFQNPVYGAFL